MGKLKNTFYNFQKEISSVTDEIDIEENIKKSKDIKKENSND